MARENIPVHKVQMTEGMDDPAYAKNVSSKFQTYISRGIIPSIHLIVIYETNQNPLSTGIIEKIVSHYFL